MKLNWPVVPFVAFAVTTFGSLLILWYTQTSIPDYGEAEPLHPLVIELAAELIERNPGLRGSAKVSLDELGTILQEDRFKALRGYGFSPGDSNDVLGVFVVNRHFEFPIQRDGTVRFHKRNADGNSKVASKAKPR